MLVPILRPIFVCLLWALALHAQKETGLPIIQYYPPSAYNAGHENWWGLQNDDGIIYVANQDGVLEHDGSTWRLIKLPNRGAAHWLTVGADKKIYVAAQSDFGRIEYSSNGFAQYVSLIDQAARDTLGLTSIWECEADSKGGVFFRQYDRIFYWSPSGIRVWRTESRFDMVGMVRDTLYVRIRTKGVYRIVNSVLEPVQGGNTFDEKINCILPIPGGILFGTRTKGLFLYNGQRFTPIVNEASEYLKKHNLYQALVLPDGRIAAASLHGGVVLMTAQTELIRVYDQKVGLNNLNVFAVFPDRQNGLWVAHGAGISRISLNTSKTVFDERSGLSLGINDMARYNGHLFAGTRHGVYRLDGNSFTEVTKTKSFVQQFLVHQNRLFVSHGTGTSVIAKDSLSKSLARNYGVLFPLPLDSNIVFVGEQAGLFALNIQTTPPTLHVIPGMTAFISSMTADSDGYLWCGTPYSGIYRLDFRKGFTIAPEIKNYSTNSGLPLGRYSVYFQRGIYADDTENLYEYDKVTDRFVVSRKLEDLETNLKELNQTLYRNAFFILPAYVKFGRAKAQSLLMRIWGLKNDITCYNLEEDGTEWIGTREQLIRFAPEADTLIGRIKTVIRKIASRDSIYTGGHITKAEYEIPYQQSGVRLEFTATMANPLSAVLYQTQLEGFETTWSPWTENAFREYPNLIPGDYRFRLRANTSSGQFSDITTTAITILPLWYRSNAAYTLYTILFLFVFYLIFRWRVRRLENQKLDLEAKVASRTSELQAALHDLKTAEGQLVQSEKMASIGNMVAGLAHEINNPLTFIIPNLEFIKKSFTEISKDASHADRHEETMDAINSSMRGGERIRDIVQNLRNFSRLESSLPNVADVTSNLQSVINLFFDQYTDIKFEYTFQSSVYARIIIREINVCFINIFTNGVQAIRDAESTGKLKRGQGRIKIEIDESSDDVIVLLISDNGAGISKDSLSKVFEPFFTTRPVGQGRGLGLSEAYATITKMGGKIRIVSDEDSGTTVVIELQKK